MDKKTTAPKCSGSLAPLAPGTKTIQAQTSKRAICPVCGGRIGLVQPKEGSLKFSTHYRKGKATEGKAPSKKAAAARPKGTPRAALANGSATKFKTASGTEYKFTPAADASDKSKPQGTVRVLDGKADKGYNEYPVYVNEAGEASFRNARQGRLVRGAIA